jgi:hypothetical protein
MLVISNRSGGGVGSSPLILQPLLCLIRVQVERDPRINCDTFVDWFYLRGTRFALAAAVNRSLFPCDFTSTSATAPSPCPQDRPICPQVRTSIHSSTQNPF